MSSPDLFPILDYIISRGLVMVQKYFPGERFPLDYVAVFSQNEKEYSALVSQIGQLGTVIETTKTGDTYRLQTPYYFGSASVYLVKIRRPDSHRLQRGSPDFRVGDFTAFKSRCTSLANMRLVTRPDYEMLELSDPDIDVLVYFPAIPLSTVIPFV